MKGYRHFYSLRRGLKYLARLRFGRLLEHLWGWLYIRRWQRTPANRAYLEELGERSAHLPAGDREAPRPDATQDEAAGSDHRAVLLADESG